MSDEQKLPPCDADVFEKGESIGLFPGIEKEDVERLCKGLSAVTGWRIDWSYFAGWPHIRALAPAEQHHGELERLRDHVSAYEASRARLHEWLRQEQLKNIALRAQLAGQTALLRDMHDSPYHYIRDFKPRIDAALSATAGPSVSSQVNHWASSSGEKWTTVGPVFLAEAGSIGGDAGIPASVERDERAEFEVESLRNNRPVDRLPSGDYLLPATRFAWQGWQARAALERNRSALVTQLQADLTERDQRIDFLEQQVQLADHWLEFASFNNVGEPVEHTQEMRDEFRKQMIAAVFPDYVAASTDGRLNGIPKKPCSGCGTPGWTGACTKCVPY